MEPTKNGENPGHYRPRISSEIITHPGGGRALLGLTMLCFLAWVAASGESVTLTGGAFSAAGILILLYPVRQRVPRVWLLAGGIWLVGSLAAFLPAGYFQAPAWREGLVAAGLGAGGSLTLQPAAAMGSLVMMTVTGIVALWATCHGVGPEQRLRLAACFAAAVSLYALIAWLVPGWLNFKSNAFGTFGFFPNRNHTATLLVMGALVSLGLMAQGFRWRRSWMIAGGTTGLILILCLLFGTNISRAGILLLVIGLILWVCLTGPRYLGGHAGKAVAIAAGGAGLYFLLVDTPVKTRIEQMIHRVSPDESSKLPADLTQRLRNLDGRIAIQNDAAAMIADAPLTGWGAGQFQYVFPQYRTHTAHLNHAVCLHPESDWWRMAAETGLPATAALVGLLAAIVVPAARSVRKGRAKALRASCLVAGLMVPIHGIIDVPGHTFSLLWISAALLAMAGDPLESPRLKKLSITGWRLAGAGILMLGVLLVHASWQGTPLLAGHRSAALFEQAMADYKNDQQTANPAANPVNGTADLLEGALGKLEQAASLTPMDPRVHGLRGMLALHFNDKDALSRQSFTNQRLLDPGWIKIPLIQADAWSGIDPKETGILWQDAMQRARQLEQSVPGTSWSISTYLSILRKAQGRPDLYQPALDAAIGNKDLLEMAATLPQHGGAKLAR